VSAAPKTCAAALAGVAGLHVAWGLGSTWPAAGREELAETLGGGQARSPAECLAVAGLLAAAAALVGGRPHAHPGLSRLGAGTVAGVLLTRAGLGLAGRTDLVVPTATSDRFRALDRRVLSPVCLALGLAALPAAASG
jgi:uncharacterized protein DUF3995